MKEVVKNLYQISSKGVNNYIFQESEKVVLIDTGLPGNLGRIKAGLDSINKSIADVTDLILTHAHGDHTGSLVELLKANPNIKTHMHEIDAELIEKGDCIRFLNSRGGLFSTIMNFMGKKMSPSKIKPTQISNKVKDDSKIKIGSVVFTIIHLPGHSAGMIGLLFEVEGQVVLITADAVVNMFGLRNIFGYEDPIKGEQSVQKLCKIDFDVACFGHGSAISGNASQVFRERFQV